MPDHPESTLPLRIPDRSLAPARYDAISSTIARHWTLGMMATIAFMIGAWNRWPEILGPVAGCPFAQDLFSQGRCHEVPESFQRLRSQLVWILLEPIGEGIGFEIPEGRSKARGCRYPPD